MLIMLTRTQLGLLRSDGPRGIKSLLDTNLAESLLTPISALAWNALYANWKVAPAPLVIPPPPLVIPPRPMGGNRHLAQKA